MLIWIEMNTIYKFLFSLCRFAHFFLVTFFSSCFFHSFRKMHCTTRTQANPKLSQIFIIIIFVCASGSGSGCWMITAGLICARQISNLCGRREKKTRETEMYASWVVQCCATDGNCNCEHSTNRYCLLQCWNHNNLHITQNPTGQMFSETVRRDDGGEKKKNVTSMHT